MLRRFLTCLVFITRPLLGQLESQTNSYQPNCMAQVSTSLFGSSSGLLEVSHIGCFYHAFGESRIADHFSVGYCGAFIVSLRFNKIWGWSYLEVLGHYSRLCSGVTPGSDKVSICGTWVWNLGHGQYSCQASASLSSQGVLVIY